jgi:sarcosine oxidase delta subunit
MGYVWTHKVIKIITEEVWKTIEIDGHVFNVSNHGRVKSKRNIVTYGTKEDNGYKRVSSNVDGKSKKVHVHILVAKAFINNEREGDTTKFVVNHKDGDKSKSHE